MILSRKYPRAPSQPPIGRERAQSPPVRASDDYWGERGYNQSSLEGTSARTGTQNQQALARIQSPTYRNLDERGYNQLILESQSNRAARLQSQQPLQCPPSRVLDDRGYIQTNLRALDYNPAATAQSPPAKVFNNSVPNRSSNQPLQRAQSPPPRASHQLADQPPAIPPRAPNERYLRDQYSPKPFRKILRKPWGKSKSVDTPYLFPYTPPPQKPPVTTKDTTSYLFTKLSNLRSKSPSPRPLDPNRKVQFLDVPPDAIPPPRRSRSPIRAVANLFARKSTTATNNKERPRSNSLSRFVKNLSHKINHTPTPPILDGYTSDSSITPYRRINNDYDLGYVSDSNTRKLSVPVTTTNSIRNTFRKFSQGTVNFARSLKSLSNERLADNLNDYEWTKQNLLRSSELLNKSTERFSSAYSGKTGGGQDSGLSKRNERPKVSESEKLFAG